MARRSRQHSSLLCAQCRAENYGFASFCISCGEPFDTVAGADFSLHENDIFLERLPEVDGNKAARQDDNAPDAPSAPVYSREHVPLHHALRERREAAIGIVLMALVLGYALYSWQRTNLESSAYKEGVTAEQSKDWDRAAAAFEKAGNHLYAPGKVLHARSQVLDRDRLYTDAVTAANSQDWKSALSALEQVQAIQPSYKESDTRFAQARSQAFNGELEDLVYLVTDGRQPGLYMLADPNAPLYLPGSDAHSVIRATSTDGARFVYDVTKTDHTPAPNKVCPGAGPKDGSTSNVADSVSVKRVPVMAEIENSSVRACPLADLDGNGTGVFSRYGLWWFTNEKSTLQYLEYSDYAQYGSTYNGSQTRTVSTVIASNPFSESKLLALDPERSRIVLGQALGLSRSAHRKTRIYIANADGTNPRFALDLEGDVKSVSISHDGLWMLAVTRWAILHLGLEETAWLVPLGVGASDVSAGPARKLETLAMGETDPPRHLSTSLVPTDNSAMTVVVGRANNRVEQVTFYNSDPNAVTYKLYSLTNAGTSFDVAAFSNNGAYLGLRRQYGTDAWLEIVSLGDEDFLHSQSLALPAQKGQMVEVGFAPHDSYVLASVQEVKGMPDNQNVVNSNVEIYSAPVSQSHDIDAMQLVATAVAQKDPMLPVTAFSSGGSMLAYVNTQRELRVSFLDSEQDTLLAPRVAAVWALGQRDDLDWTK